MHSWSFFGRTKQHQPFNNGLDNRALWDVIMIISLLLLWLSLLLLLSLSNCTGLLTTRMLLVFLCYLLNCVDIAIAIITFGVCLVWMSMSLSFTSSLPFIFLFFVSFSFILTYFCHVVFVLSHDLMSFSSSYFLSLAAKILLWLHSSTKFTYKKEICIHCLNP